MPSGGWSRGCPRCHGDKAPPRGLGRNQAAKPGSAPRLRPNHALGTPEVFSRLPIAIAPLLPRLRFNRGLEGLAPTGGGVRRARFRQHGSVRAESCPLVARQPKDWSRRGLAREDTLCLSWQKTLSRSRVGKGRAPAVRQRMTRVSHPVDTRRSSPLPTRGSQVSKVTWDTTDPAEGQPGLPDLQQF